MPAGRRGLPVLALLGAFLLPASLFGAEFSVSPIRVDFDRATRTSALTIRNDGAERLEVQVTLSEWTQDDTGKDVYSDSKDLVFFPKLVTVEPGSEATVRVGVRNLPPQAERTYRLYVEEIPAPRKEGGSQVNVRVRFGVGLFVKPPVETLSGEIVAFDVDKGIVQVPVRNTGTVSFKVDKVVLCGTRRNGEPVQKEIGGWYVLAGATRTFQVALSPAECREIVRLDAEVLGETVRLAAGLDVGDGGCAN